MRGGVNILTHSEMYTQSPDLIITYINVADILIETLHRVCSRALEMMTTKVIDT